jgi:hypothetical protein
VINAICWALQSSYFFFSQTKRVSIAKIRTRAELGIKDIDLTRLVKWLSRHPKHQLAKATKNKHEYKENKVIRYGRCAQCCTTLIVIPIIVGTTRNDPTSGETCDAAPQRTPELPSIETP